MVSATAILAGGVLASEPAHASATDAVDTVRVTSANSGDITTTTAGAAALREFASKIAKASPGITAKTANQLEADYSVLQVDVEKVRSQVAPGVSCADADGYINTEDVLVAPRGVTNIRYEIDEDQELDPQDDPDAAANRCNTNIVWDEADTGGTNDDPDAGASTTRPYDYKYASDCFARKKHYKKDGDLNIYESWNDGCYADYVVRYDGNAAWNYYTVKSMSTCKNNQSNMLLSCGHGVKQNKAKNDGRPQWDDWAPNSDSTGDCRSKSISVSAGPISVGGSYTHCEKQKIYKYTEAGKMSSYWKDRRDGTRGTQHQISVKYPPGSRPHWSHWLNSDACICLQD
ncbi:hypothetical protein ACIO93_42545 [Streptomyces sp. NPDC087903]|uniref:hypothetical protein n=1 Tax=Streptomyces sp. NPDC087903 TaxID=3365819 RepID=UPI0037FF9918